MQTTITINLDTADVNNWLNTVKKGNDVVTKIADGCKTDADRVAVFQDFIQQQISNDFLQTTVNKQIETAKAENPTLTTPFDDRVKTASDDIQAAVSSPK